MTKRSYLVLVSLILLVMMFVAGCGGPAVAKNGDTVKVHYTGRLEDGTVFDTSIGSEPLEFTLGQSQLIPGFEQAVIGMQVGESKTVTIPADEAYGPRRDDMVLEVDKDELPDDLEPEVGMYLQMNQGDGGMVVVTITEVSETTITIDANHPLAGQDLTFDIELVEIVASKGDKTESGLTSLPLGQALSSGKPTLAEFGSSTCVPCKQMKPILEELAVKYKGKLNVVIVEVYDHIDLARQYQIMAIPTQIVYDRYGREITRHMGLWPKEEITAYLRTQGID